MIRSFSVGLAVSILGLWMAGCAGLPRDAGQASTALQPFEATDHPGFWQSEGYGYVYHATPTRLALYHVAGDVCVPQPENELALLDFLDLYRAGEKSDTLYLSSVLDPFEYTFRRAEALPAACRAVPADTPLENFDALAAYFRTHYSFFDLYGVDWEERVAEARDAISPDMTDRALFDAMAELLQPLKDAHIQIEAEIDGEEVVYDGNPGRTDQAVVARGRQDGMTPGEATRQFRRSYWQDGIRDTLLRGEGKLAGNGRIQYGLLSESVGYMTFVSMGGYVDGEFDTAYEERSALDPIMEEALALFAGQGVEAVIIDLSLNIGGYDFIGLDIAGRFAAERTLAFTRRAGDTPNSLDFALYVEPAAGRRFTGPVYVLTSDLTVSAGEILTMGLRALGNVTHVGERTRGALSTVLTKYLPNGWEVSLSNEIYTDAAGEQWEGRGIEPEVKLSVFDADNPTPGHVEAVRAVQRLIRQQH